MEYFWKQQYDIPAGMGYPLFGVAHLLSVLVTLSFVTALIIALRHSDEKKQLRFLKSLPIFMVFLELFKDGFLIHVHRFGLGYLPLHVCSIGIFVFLLREYLPWKKAKEVLGEIAFILIMPGAIAALIFPDWTTLYPVFNFMNLYSYVWHGALVLYPVMLMVRGDIAPTVKHIHWVIGFLCVVVPPIYAFDKHFGCNYFFVNRPVADTPLEWMASFMGNPGYLIGYAALTVSVIILMYLFVYLIKRIYCKKSE